MADRAINMPLRVTGIGEVERDFKRVGDAGSKNFAQIEKSANGAAREVSEYTARLKRAAAEANRRVANMPELNKGSASEIRANQRDFRLGFINAEKDRIRGGLADLTREYGRAEQAGATFGGSLTRVAGLAAAAGTAIYGLGRFLYDSVGAFADHERAIASFDARLALAGNRSNATGDEIKEMADKVVAATGQTEKAVLSAATTLAKVPGITKEALQQALDLSALMADKLGEEAPKAAGEMADALTALADGDLKAFHAATKDLDDGLVNLVTALVAAGKNAEAQQAYMAGLAERVGKGPDGLTKSTDDLTESWNRLKLSFGEAFSGPAATAMNWLAGYIDTLRGKIEDTRASWRALLSGEAPLSGGLNFDPLLPTGRRNNSTVRIDLDDARRRTAERDAAAGNPARAAAERAERKANEEKYGGSAKSGRAAARTNAQILADFQRELAKRGVQTLNNPVRTAAQQNALFKQGLTPLDGYNRPSRHQNAQAIDFNRATFNENKVREAAMAAGLKGFELVTESGGRKHAEWTGGGKPGDISDFLRGDERAAAQAERQRADAERRQRAFEQHVAGLDMEILRAKMARVGHGAELTQLIQQQIKIEGEKYAADVDAKVKDGDLSELQAKELKSKKEIALAMESQAVTAQEQTRQIQEAFADQVAANDNQRDLLAAQEGIATTVKDRRALAIALLKLDQEEERLRLQTIVDQGKIANATAEQRKAAEQASARLSILPTIEDAQRQGVARQNQTSLERFIDDTDPKGTEDKVDELVYDELMSVRRGINSAISDALGTDDPLITGLIELLLDQVLFRPLAQALQGGMSGGGGGGLGSIFGAVLGAVGGGISGGTVARLAPDVISNIAANPSLFASGTPSLPTGRPFDVGENGRERMLYHGNGRLEVISGPQSHRESAGGGNLTLVQNNFIPERSDPRRTASGIARANSRSMAIASRKGLAVPGGRR